MTIENLQHFCIKCGNILDENLECPICKKKKEKRKIMNMLIIFTVILVLGGIAMFFYYEQIYDIQNPIKVYEAKCEEGQDMCFKGDLIKTTSINGTYSDFSRTCNCQKCYEKDVNDPIELIGFSECGELMRAVNYMRCEEFVCSNKFVIRIDE